MINILLCCIAGLIVLGAIIFFLSELSSKEEETETVEVFDTKDSHRKEFY